MVECVAVTTTTTHRGRSCTVAALCTRHQLDIMISTARTYMVVVTNTAANEFTARKVHAETFVRDKQKEKKTHTTKKSKAVEL